jgi:hypothetical protein
VPPESIRKLPKQLEKTLSLSKCIEDSAKTPRKPSRGAAVAYLDTSAGHPRAAGQGAGRVAIVFQRLDALDLHDFEQRIQQRPFFFKWLGLVP